MITKFYLRKEENFVRSGYRYKLLFKCNKQKVIKYFRIFKKVQNADFFIELQCATTSLKISLKIK